MGKGKKNRVQRFPKIKGGKYLQSFYGFLISLPVGFFVFGGVLCVYVLVFLFFI